jgi:hypothetical protein
VYSFRLVRLLKEHAKACVLCNFKCSSKAPRDLPCLEARLDYEIVSSQKEKKNSADPSRKSNRDEGVCEVDNVTTESSEKKILGQRQAPRAFSTSC